MSLCESCHGGCCRSFAVPVTGADILRIETETDLSFWDFVCRWADPQGHVSCNYVPQFHFDDEPDTPFVICLMHEMSEYFAGTTKCRFLLEDAPTDEHHLGLARCGVYEHRPAACRAFPAKLNSDGDLAVIYDVPSRGRAENDSVYNLCARPWEPSDLDPIQTVQDLIVAKFEIEFFRQLAVTWNRTLRPWSIFPEFLHLVYSSRVSKSAVQPSKEAEPAAIKLANVGQQAPRRAA